VVVTVGEATGFEMFGLLKLPAGDQLYIIPPEAFSVTLKPGHIHPGWGPALGTGNGFINTVTKSVFVQLFPSVSVKVYVVVDVGLATGLAQVVQLSPVEGLHEKFPPPVPFSVVEFPVQMETSAPALTAGRGKTFTTT